MAEDQVQALVMPPARKMLPHAVLFVLSLITMLTAGAMQEISAHALDILRAPELLSHGIIYTLALLGILMARDLGHWAAASAHDLELSFPYYIPAPTLFGTLGSIVTTESMPRDKRALFDVAVAGPLCGFLVALPMAVLGIMWSDPLDSSTFGAPPFSEPLLFDWLVRLLKPEALDVGLRLHPMALAAWTGFLVTALSLLPIGQLDGGHMAFAVLGRRHTWLGALALALLVAIGVVFQAPLWIVWALIALLVGYKHPPVRETTIQLGSLRYALCGLLVLVLLTTFSLQPSAGLAP